METDPRKLLDLAMKSILAVLPTIEKAAGTYPQRVIAHYANDQTRMEVSTARVTDGFKPIETAVHHPRYNRGKWMIVEAYDTVSEAELGHSKWIGIMNGELPALIKDCVNCVSARCVLEAEGKLEYPLDPTP